MTAQSASRSAHRPPVVHSIDPSQDSPFDPQAAGAGALQIEGKAILHASREELFAHFDPGRMTTWMPLLSRVRMDHSSSAAGDACGVGSVRACDVPGLGTVRETVLWWKPPVGHAFRADSARLGITDHVVVFRFEPIANGDSVMTMRHYWTANRWFGRFAPFAMGWLMNRLFRNIRRSVGGFATRVARTKGRR